MSKRGNIWTPAVMIVETSPTQPIAHIYPQNVPKVGKYIPSEGRGRGGGGCEEYKSISGAQSKSTFSPVSSFLSSFRGPKRLPSISWSFDLTCCFC